MPNVSFAQPDVTLLLDLEGVIRKATLSSTVCRRDRRGLARPALGARPSRMAAAAACGSMVEDARRTGVSAFRQVAQRFPSGRELPMEYTTVRLGEQAGLLAIGKNLQAVAELQSRLIAAQQAMERDYWKLREVETRYRAAVRRVERGGPGDPRRRPRRSSRPIPRRSARSAWRRPAATCWRELAAADREPLPGHAGAGARARARRRACSSISAATAGRGWCAPR